MIKDDQRTSDSANAVEFTNDAPMRVDNQVQGYQQRDAGLSIHDFNEQISNLI